MSLLIGIVAPGPIQRVAKDVWGGHATGAECKDEDQPMQMNATRKGGSRFQTRVFVCSLYQT